MLLAAADACCAALFCSLLTGAGPAAPETSRPGHTPGAVHRPLHAEVKVSAGRRCEGPSAPQPRERWRAGRSSAARHNPRAGHSPPAPVGEQRTATTRAWHRQGGAGGNGRVVRPPRRPSEREGAIRSFHASLPPGASQRLINPALHTHQSHRRPSRRLPWSADCCPSTSRSGPSTEDGGGAYTALVALPIHSALSPPHPMPQTGMSKGSMAT